MTLSDEALHGLFATADLLVLSQSQKTVTVWIVSWLRYDSDLARFEDLPPVAKTSDPAFKHCPSCLRIRQKEQVP